MTKSFIIACLLLISSRAIGADFYTIRENFESFFSTGIGIAVLAFLISVFILWFLLPFAVFGSKNRLNQIIEEAKETNYLLNEIKDELVKNRTKESSEKHQEEKIASIEKFL